MRSYLSVIIILITTLSMNAQSNPSPTLPDTKWLLSKIHLDTVRQVDGKRAYMQLTTEKNRVSGNGSCNRFGGSYHLKGDSLSFDKLFSTKMYCPDLQQTEDHFLGLLHKVNRYTIKGNRLFLLRDNILFLEFIKE